MEEKLAGLQDAYRNDLCIGLANAYANGDWTAVIERLDRIDGVEDIVFECFIEVAKECCVFDMFGTIPENIVRRVLQGRRAPELAADLFFAGRKHHYKEVVTHLRGTGRACMFALYKYIRDEPRWPALSDDRTRCANVLAKIQAVFYETIDKKTDDLVERMRVCSECVPIYYYFEGAPVREGEVATCIEKM